MATKKKLKRAKKNQPTVAKKKAAPVAKETPIGYRYLALYDDTSRQWVVSPITSSSPRWTDAYESRVEAERRCQQHERNAIEQQVIQSRIASRERIGAGIKSLTPEDLVNLRDFLVSLLYLRVQS